MTLVECSSPSSGKKKAAEADTGLELHMGQVTLLDRELACTTDMTIIWVKLILLSQIHQIQYITRDILFWAIKIIINTQRFPGHNQNNLHLGRKSTNTITIAKEPRRLESRKAQPQRAIKQPKMPVSFKDCLSLALGCDLHRLL